MPIRRTVSDAPAYLSPIVARILLARCKAKQGVRLSYAVMLMQADASGIVMGHTRELGRCAGFEQATFRGHLAVLRQLGELETVRIPTTRRPGIWRITAIA